MIEAGNPSLLVAPPLSVTVVVPACNEAANIGRLMRRLFDEPLGPVARIQSVVVVASGCSDGTEAEVTAFAREELRVKLVSEAVRSGKAAALNLGFGARPAPSDVLVVASADVLPAPGALRLLLEALRESPGLGMVGGRPVPTGTDGSLVGGMVRFLWKLHDAAAQRRPKLGELVAIRERLMRPLPASAAADEAQLEAFVRDQGARLGYVRDAVLFNCGPARFIDYIRHRRRIAAGHYAVRREAGYAVSTLPWLPMALLAARALSREPLGCWPAALAAIAVEPVARMLGGLDTLLGRSHAVWTMFPSARTPSLEAGLALAGAPPTSHAGGR